MIDVKHYMDMCEEYSQRVADLESALADLLPYATACVGLPRESWPVDSAILRAEKLLRERTWDAFQNSRR